MDKKIAQLFSMVSDARHCIALTGAGISALSGIPDFRSKNGLYTAGMLGEKVFDSDEFEKDPSYFYTNAGPLVYTVHEKEPSIVHTCLAELERRGVLKAVITQNIDMLHQKAGSRRVIEVHGSPRMHYCLRCAGVRVGYAEAAAVVRAGDMPRCPHCGRVLKPAITFYGERLPLEARRDAEGEAQDADLMLILGSSLTVMPAAAIPRTTVQRGGRLVIVTDMRTPLDDDAAMRFWDLEDVFSGLDDLLDRPPGPR